MSINYSSVSRIPIKININEAVFYGDLVRHLSPLTVKKIIEHLPLSNRTSKFEKIFVYVKTNLELGSEKSKKDFKKGDLAFSPSGSFICIFLKDHIHNQWLNPIGNIHDDNIEVLSELKTGTILTISKNNNL